MIKIKQENSRKIGKLQKRGKIKEKPLVQKLEINQKKSPINYVFPFP